MVILHWKNKMEYNNNNNDAMKKRKNTNAVFRHILVDSTVNLFGQINCLTLQNNTPAYIICFNAT